jgi:hypothetical protein
MNTVILRVEAELDPSAAPRVFGYLGGLGHVPLHAALRRGGETLAEKMIMEVHFESPVPAAERISAKVEQMPFVLTSSIARSDPSAEDSGPENEKLRSDTGSKGPEGMGHAPANAIPCSMRFDVTALQFAAAQRSHAIRHRSQVHLNA